MVKLGGIPGAAWTISSLSLFVLSIGVCVSTIRSRNLTLEAANVKLQTTGKLNTVLELSSDLEKTLDSLQRQQQAYQELKQQYDAAVKVNKNGSLSKLKPAFEKVDESVDSIDLNQLESQIEKTEIQVTAEIKELVQERTSHGFESNSKPLSSENEPISDN